MTTERAEYFTNLWEHRTRRDSAGRPIYEPDTFTVETDALENITDPMDGWIYVETIHRHADGTAVVANLYDRALDWDHERTRRERAESERANCYTKQRRAG